MKFNDPRMKLYKYGSNQSRNRDRSTRFEAYGRGNAETHLAPRIRHVDFPMKARVRIFSPGYRNDGTLFMCSEKLNRNI